MRSFTDFYFLGVVIGRTFRFIFRIILSPVEFAYTVSAGFPHATFEELMHTIAVCAAGVIPFYLTRHPICLVKTGLSPLI